MYYQETEYMRCFHNFKNICVDYDHIAYHQYILSYNAFMPQKSVNQQVFSYIFKLRTQLLCISYKHVLSDVSP